MMQFLRSILSRDKKNNQEKELQEALLRIQLLEKRVETMSSTISDLSKCITDVAVATRALAQDNATLALAITELAGPSESKTSMSAWFPDDDDDYLN